MGTNNALSALAALVGAIPEIVRQGLYQYYSDDFKGLHGIRPRWAYDWSIAQLEEGMRENQAEADRQYHEYDCPDCWNGEVCRERMPTSGEGWSFTPAL